MVDETSDIHLVSQLATMLWCVVDGKIQARFVVFTDVIADRSLMVFSVMYRI
jgi:hypothetical protein